MHYLINTKKLSELTGMSTSAIEKERFNPHDNAIPFIKVEKRTIRYSIQDVQAWIEKNRISPNVNISSNGDNHD